MVSTDKAVNPTSVMGATKRICEMIVQSHSQIKQHTTFSATRFGNVLGSAGSVIPLFKRQIAQGGPVTLTDKRIIRYFMTIPEASQLVLCSASMAKNGELFVLDMGQPVRIYDLATNMIRMSGLEPDKDIEIKEIGLRPGEKLYEELLVKTEELDKTDKEVLDYYVMDAGAYDVNYVLRNPEAFKTENDKRAIKSLDNVINKSSLNKDVETYRYISNENVFKNMKVGDVYEDKGFMSTTYNQKTDREDNFQDYRVKAIIKAK